MNGDRSPLPAGFEYRLDLARHVTPRLLKDQPVHRWFYFPHSYSPQLVEVLLDEWQLGSKAVILDPFVGAGTTLRVAGERGLDAVGVDVSPLATFVSRAKVARYGRNEVQEALRAVLADVEQAAATDVDRTDRLERAFSDAEFDILLRLRESIGRQSAEVQPLLLLALLRVQQTISRARPDGGWFRWVERENQAHLIRPAFAETVMGMLQDLASAPSLNGARSEVRQLDARRLDLLVENSAIATGGFDAIITSPPYPNRHDYSRVFQIELLTLGLQESDIFSLRYDSIRSHVEARPPQGHVLPFRPTPLLQQTLAQLPETIDRRVRAMLWGYFEDMNAVLQSACTVLRPEGRIALVVGNVRHAGVMVPVDEILVEMGVALGYEPLTSWVARMRGNSAQQMGRFGREPARESIVMLRKRDPNR